MTKPTDFFQEPPEQGPVGKRPESYFKDLPAPAGTYVASIAKVPGKGSKILDRSQVLKVGQDTTIDPLVAYACIMAWGGRNFRNYRLSLGNGNATKVSDLVRYLRASGVSREEDFAYTQKAAEKIPGLGISFYTKLLFFLRKKPDAYILDQWTAKSASVLSSFPKIELTSAGLPHPKTSPKTYEAFCAAIDKCAGPSGWGSAWKNGEDVERTIFDRPGGKWRTWLKTQIGEEVFNPDGSIAAGAVGREPPPPRDELPPQGAGGEAGGRDDSKRAWFLYLLKATYLTNLGMGANLPEVCGNPNSGNRLHVRYRRGVTLQFIATGDSARAQIYVSKLPDYLALAAAAGAAPHPDGHDFQHGILGNGTHAIDLYAVVPGGYDHPVAEWPAICQSAVDAMQQLFEFFEPYLP
jgi:hypothetical protein